MHLFKTSLDNEICGFMKFIYKKHNSYYLIGIHKDNFILSDYETLL